MLFAGIALDAQKLNDLRMLINHLSRSSVEGAPDTLSWQVLCVMQHQL